jgi:hypothetical protein
LSESAPPVQEGGLAEALAPLHRAYLRRLDEMAGRVEAAALLREPTTRDERGRLVLGADGLAMRFDVADRKTGSTFEVRSARYDAPAVDRLVVGVLDVELKPGCWEALPVACRFDNPPVPEDEAALVALLRAFAELGHHGGFAPRGAQRPWLGRIHGVQVAVGGEVVSALYDLGSAPPSALEVLVQALDGFGVDRAPLAKVTIGGPVPDAPKQGLVPSGPPLAPAAV